jgi:hypothetical protein
VGRAWAAPQQWSQHYRPPQPSLTITTVALLPALQVFRLRRVDGDNDGSSSDDDHRSKTVRGVDEEGPFYQVRAAAPRAAQARISTVHGGEPSN